MFRNEFNHATYRANHFSLYFVNFAQDSWKKGRLSAAHKSNNPYQRPRFHVKVDVHKARFPCATFLLIPRKSTIFNENSSWIFGKERQKKVTVTKALRFTGCIVRNTAVHVHASCTLTKFTVPTHRSCPQSDPLSKCLHFPRYPRKFNSLRRKTRILWTWGMYVYNHIANLLRRAALASVSWHICCSGSGVPRPIRDNCHNVSHSRSRTVDNRPKIWWLVMIFASRYVSLKQILGTH